MRFSIYPGANGQWYWRAGPSTGGRKTADGSEGYTRKADAERAVERFIAAVRAGVIVQVEGSGEISPDTRRTVRSKRTKRAIRPR